MRSSPVYFALCWPSNGGLTPLVFFAWCPLLLSGRTFRDKSQRGEAPPFHAVCVYLRGGLERADDLVAACVSESMGSKLFAVIGPNIGNDLPCACPGS